MCHDNDRLFKRLREALNDDQSQDLDALRAEISDAGVNPDEVLARGLGLFDTFLKQQRLIHARQRLNLLRDAISDIRTNVTNNIDTAKRSISEALAVGQGEQQVLAFYQKLQSVERDDLLSLEDDIALLEFIEEMIPEDGS